LQLSFAKTSMTDVRGKPRWPWISSRTMIQEMNT
jgi:hypothetical protein